jgi:hypothetical protein
VDNLISKKIFDEAISRKLQSYIDFINSYGAVIDKVRNGLVNSPNSSFIATTRAKYSKIESYTKHISFYNDQIVGMLEQVNEYELCDNKTRNMNNKQLEAFFASADTILEILQAKEELFNNYILGAKNKYSASTIYSRFGQMFNALVLDSKNEVEDIFRDYNNQPAYKINLIIDMLKIMRDKKMKLIPMDLVNKELTELERLLKAKFASTKAECAKKMENVKQTFLKVQNEIEIKTTKRNEQIRNAKDFNK